MPQNIYEILSEKKNFDWPKVASEYYSWKISLLDSCLIIEYLLLMWPNILAFILHDIFSQVRVFIFLLTSKIECKHNLKFQLNFELNHALIF